ncbi:MAG: hypothetical protein CL878_01550 [Dehalococcoidia bacterium]|nr:hypothetical protein [Dehalococcoidia bacterium]
MPTTPPLAPSDPAQPSPYDTALQARMPSPDHPCFRVWRDYTRSGVARGERVAASLEAFGPLAGQHIVDMGCGDGAVAAALASHGAATVAVDISHEQLRDGASRSRELGVAVTPLVGDALRMPVPTRSADIVICNDVLEHVADPEQCLAEARRILKPAGVLYLSVPNRWSLLNVWTDPHYGLPIVAALPRQFAAPLVTRVWRRNPTYAVEALLSWSRLRRLLAAQAFSISDARCDWRLTYLLAKLRGDEAVIAGHKRRFKRMLDMTGLSSLLVAALRPLVAVGWRCWVRGWIVIARAGR